LGCGSLAQGTAYISAPIERRTIAVAEAAPDRIAGLLLVSRMIAATHPA
jgi:hypothetical protein